MATALITGASDGIGLELARIHAAAHDDLILVARRLDLLEKLREELVAAHRINVHCYEMDLSLPANIDRLHQSTTASGLKIDFLINNAGFGSIGPFVDSRWERDASMIDLNVRAVAHLTHLYARDMVNQGGGRIMNVASTAAFQPGPGMAVYFATKAFVLHFSEALHLELKRHNVSVTTLCPGPTQSGFAKAMREPGSPSPAMLASKRIPDSASVARYGYRAMMRGQAVAIHGWMNALMAASSRLVPRSWVVRISASITGGL
jgi:short-subunit dehydrogenase